MIHLSGDPLYSTAALALAALPGPPLASSRGDGGDGGAHYPDAAPTAAPAAAPAARWRAARPPDETPVAQLSVRRPQTRVAAQRQRRHGDAGIVPVVLLIALL